jgi:hypothetical protein
VYPGGLDAGYIYLVKKFALRSFLAAMVVSIVALFGIVAPAQAIGTADCPASSSYTYGYRQGAPSFSNSLQIPGYLFPTQNVAYVSTTSFQTTGFTSAPTFTITPTLPAGLSINSSTGVISGTATVATAATDYLIMATGPSAASVAQSGNYCIAWQLNMTVNGNGGGNQQQQQQTPPTRFTVANSNFSVPGGESIATLASGASFPEFTFTASGYSGGATFDLINILLGDPRNDVFFGIPGSVSQQGNSYATWDPAGNNCGVTSLSLGGTAQTASSGITCLKISDTYNGVTQKWVSLRLASATSGAVSGRVASGTFTALAPSAANRFWVSLLTFNGSPRYQSNIEQLFTQAGGIGSSGSPVAFAIPVGVGQSIVGSNVDITANDIALSTDYSVVLRSTPQILAQGRTVSSSFNTSVTIPSGLEAGWHSITFNATRSDGTALSEVVYFKIDANGLLLATTTETPAELAFTGAPAPWGWWIPVILLMFGVMSVLIAREINPDFMRVFSMVRGANGEYEFIKRRIRSEDF